MKINLTIDGFNNELLYFYSLVVINFTFTYDAYMRQNLTHWKLYKILKAFIIPGNFTLHSLYRSSTGIVSPTHHSKTFA